MLKANSHEFPLKPNLQLCSICELCAWGTGTRRRWDIWFSLLFFLLPFTICCSAERICNALTPKVVYFGLCKASQSALFWCVFCSYIAAAFLFAAFISIFSLLWYIKAVSFPCIFCQEEWMKKWLFYDYLNDYLVKFFLQALCVQLHAFYLVCAAQSSENSRRHL